MSAFHTSFPHAPRALLQRLLQHAPRIRNRRLNAQSPVHERRSIKKSASISPTAQYPGDPKRMLSLPINQTLNPQRLALSNFRYANPVDCPALPARRKIWLMSPKTTLPPLTEEAQREALAKGVREFNSWRYFDCHETLEDVWRSEAGVDALLLGGTLQIGL